MEILPLARLITRFVDTISVISNKKFWTVREGPPLSKDESKNVTTATTTTIACEREHATAMDRHVAANSRDQPPQTVHKLFVEKVGNRQQGSLMPRGCLTFFEF